MIPMWKTEEKDKKSQKIGKTGSKKVYVPPDRPEFWIFPVIKDFCSNDDHHCLKVMLMKGLHGWMNGWMDTMKTKPKTTIIQYFIALNLINHH